ncbi:hypothetical protein M6B38_322075 [Iris pallida]|uniref:Uncharacterized protein n=1 Tax=Iris pallida TaxID=29817 RepID=A0AAX6HBU1_IRIPA|nr:hypothetical protein M6B38_322075 [Iris pallida]
MSTGAPPSSKPPRRCNRWLRSRPPPPFSPDIIDIAWSRGAMSHPILVETVIDEIETTTAEECSRPPSIGVTRFRSAEPSPRLRSGLRADAAALPAPRLRGRARRVIRR